MTSHEDAVVVSTLMTATLFLAFVLGHLINISRIRNVPQSTAAILVGVALAILLEYKSGSRINLIFTFHPQFFYFFLLPPIVLEAGFSLDRPNFLKNIGPILWFAIGGTVITAVVTAEIVNIFARRLGLQGSDAEIRSYCWLFGVLLSAVDPVATISILGGSRFDADERLFSLVFGESILNDAVAIVLFQTVGSVVTRLQNEAIEPGTAEVAAILLEICLSFLWVTVLSIVVGLAVSGIAFVSFRVSRGLKKFPEYELGLLLLLSYMSFAVAELLQASGILTIFIVGSLLGHYNLRNLSPSSQRSSALLFKVLAVLSETFIYILFGVSVTESIWQQDSHSIPLILTTFAALMVGRGICVFPSAWLLNSVWRCDHQTDSEFARACLHALCSTGETPKGTAESPLARSFVVSPHHGHESLTHQNSTGLVRPEGIIEEESFFSRQSTVRGRMQERLQLLAFDAASPAASVPGSTQDGVASPVEQALAGLPMRDVLLTGHNEVYVRAPSQRMTDYLDILRQAHKWRQANRISEEEDEPYLSFPCQVLLWLSGLRGAVAFVLALSIPQIGKDNAHNAKLVVSSTLAMVILTTVLLGSTIELFAIHFGIIRHVGSLSSESEPPTALPRVPYTQAKSQDTWHYAESPLLETTDHTAFLMGCHTLKHLHPRHASHLSLETAYHEARTMHDCCDGDATRSIPKIVCHSSTDPSP